jgi:hypothetical protein
MLKGKKEHILQKEPALTNALKERKYSHGGKEKGRGE